MMAVVSYPMAPTTTRLRGTLLDTATVTNDFAGLDGEALFDSYNCMKFRSDAPFCAPNAKTFTQSPAWQDGWRFGVYGGVVCKSIGLDMDRMVSEVTRVFDAGESTGVERAFMSTRFRVSAGNWVVPPDITPTPGTAVSPVVGLALLEGYAADNYVGVPTLHVPRTIASILNGSNRMVWDGDVLMTTMGSKVAAGAGYDYPNTSPTGVAAPAGTRWLYSTGEVFVGRSEVIIRQAFEQSTNEVFVLGERAYIAAADCFSAAVLVTVTG